VLELLLVVFEIVSVFATELDLSPIVADIFTVIPEMDILLEVLVGLVNVVIVNCRDFVKRLKDFDVEAMLLVLAPLDPVLELTVVVEEGLESVVE
jgi:hypothetical protein